MDSKSFIPFNIMNIDTLLEAADYIERRDREAEHGYATTVPMAHNYQRHMKERSQQRKQDALRRRNITTINSKANRSSHNELEKNRRAQLRNCLDRLKEMVPVGVNSTKHTTLGLLTKAKHFIKVLEAREKTKHAAIEQLTRKRTALRSRLAVLEQGHWRQSGDRSLSESSGTSSSSNHSATSESDDVDVCGYDTESAGAISDTENDSSTMDDVSLFGDGCSFSTGLLSLNTSGPAATRTSARRANILRKQLMKQHHIYSGARRAASASSSMSAH